ncbi:hypothetical protein HADU_06694 [Acinetobacter sp. HA]|uniref:hypothetical protein n=1 Tax=Acinetobacter sp. HA TaxID=1173062 RepID=UPI000263E6A8|nr:hypothetical protein [Acinetobacter sp. HA]EIM39514.1 hypothetical protein HADU_06694 [Acinetobacter sp. HA]
MSLIEKCGGQGSAEMIAALVLTNAPCPEGYFPQLQKYFSVLDGHVYLYHEKKHEFLPYMDLDKVYLDYIWLKDLRAEIKVVVQEGAA